jgi:hypothetical protein
MQGWEKLPSTAELIAWVRVLHTAGIDPEEIARTSLRDLPFQGTLAKTQQDLGMFERPTG